MTHLKPSQTISWSDFEKVDIRLGTVVKAEEFPEARNPAYKLQIDFGDQIGILKSSAQITERYTVQSLIGKRVLGVVNFPAKQIGPVRSECLIVGFHNEQGHVTLATLDDQSPDQSAKTNSGDCIPQNGAKLA